MPSTTSRTVSADFDSSTVMTPSLPTFSIASAIRLPIVLSLFEAIVATWSISLATVTPSLVIVGLPNFLSMTTLRPLGPRVAFTASAMMLTPLSSALRASSSNLSCLGMDRVPPLLENGEDVFLAQDEIFLVVDLDLGARILAEQDLVAGLHVERDLLAVVADLPGPGGDHLTLLRLLLGRVRDDDPAPADLLLLEPLDEDAVVQRTNLHGVSASLALC